MNTTRVAPPFLSSADRTGTGLEFLRQVVAGELANLPIGDTMGFHVAEADKGRVVLRGKPDRRFYNYLDSVHGGWAAAILDTALALSTLSTLDADHSFTTVDFKLNFLRPITDTTGEVAAEGKVLHGGRRLALCEARLVDSGGKLLVHATGTCLVVPRK